MTDYIIFSKKYKGIIIGILREDTYNELLEYVSGLIDELVDLGDIRLDDIESFTEYVMATLLSRQSAQSILFKHDDESILNTISTSYKKYSDKLRLNVKPINLEHTKINSRNEKLNEENKKRSLQYISNFLHNISSIFKEGTNINKLTNDIYESLVFDGYNDNQIINGASDNIILGYIRNRYFGIEFSKDFDNLYKLSKDKTNNVFRKNEQNSELSTVERNFYSGYNKLSYIAFRVALGLTLNGIDYTKARQMNGLNSFIQSNIQSELLKINSVRNEELKQRKEEKIKNIDMEALKEDVKRKLLVFLVIFGIVAADNLIYRAFHKTKEEDNKTRKEPIVNATNYNYNLSDLDNIDINDLYQNGRGK